jgi:FecR protein
LTSVASFTKSAQTLRLELQLTIEDRVPWRGSVPLILAIAYLGILVCPQDGAAQQIVGTVTQLSGSVQLLRAGVTSGLAPAMPVQLHDQITTGVASAVTVTLADNQSTVALAESSTLVFDENVVAGGVRQRTLVRLLAGGMSSLIRTALYRGIPTFEVHTPNATAATRGTDFDTTYISGVIRPGYQGCQRYTDVIVREGVVALTNPANPTAEVDVPAGYETTVPCLLPPLNAGPIGLTGATAPGTAAGRSAGGLAAVGAAAAVGGFSAPPPGVGGAPPPPPALPPPFVPE